MTDHKFTDDDVVKALECCRDFGDCSLCPYEEAHFEDEFDCTERIHTDALALINRQKREIERLNAVNSDMNESLRLAAEANKDMQAEIAEYQKHIDNDIIYVNRVKAEAIKEFAEAVKMEFYREFDEVIPSVMADKIDTLVKEMTGEAEP